MIVQFRMKNTCKIEKVEWSIVAMRRIPELLAICPALESPTESNPRIEYWQPTASATLGIEESGLTSPA
jgi:hypothetical protein